MATGKTSLYTETKAGLNYEQGGKYATHTDIGCR